MRGLRILMLLAGLIAAPVLAEPAPVVAPVPDWVDLPPIPEGNPKLADKPLQSLLVTPQSHYSADGGIDYFVEYATAVQNPQGLTALGNLVIAWQPEQADLIVHKMHIVRAGKVIDLLANQQFTVLRRENNLESAMLDGVLTAVLQPEGLSVGDVVDIAYTIHMKKGSIPFRGENLLTLNHGSPTRFARFREIWEDGMEVRWRATDAMGKPKLKKGRWGNELVLDLRDAEGPEPPANAPARFQVPASLEISAYRDWSDIGRMLAPLYATARTPGASSPLKAEIQRIAAASADPKARAMAALRLVQDKIRYLALAMGEGGYVPAGADQTWSRKFGDCKGKTVTLLALLDGLGIEAEPVLVSTNLGDSLNERLPGVRYFNHVLVRARIAGKSYWLDGTRMGDRRIEDLVSLGYGYGLPVTAAGAALERLPLAPADLPITETRLTLDASGGFDHPVPVTAEIVMRAEAAAQVRAAMTQMGRDALRDAMREGFSHMPSDEAVTSFDIKEDDSAGTVTLTFAGTSNLDWVRAPGSTARRYRFEDDTIRWNLDTDRKAGPFSDAPFAFPFPAYISSIQTMILPNRGEGFTIDGQNFERDVAGVHIARTMGIENGRAVARSTFRRLEKELPAAQVLAAKDALAQVNSDRAYIREPLTYQAPASEKAAILALQPTSERGFTDRGYRLLYDGKTAEALADFDRAVALSPQSARAHANRAMALLYRNKLADAETALARASALDEDQEDVVVHQGYGLLQLAREKPADAARSFTRALELDPDNLISLGGRIQAYEELGRQTDAMTDIERSLRIEPDSVDMLEHKARIAAFKGDKEAALAAADTLAASEGQKAYGLSLRGDLLARFGRSEEAAAAYREAIATLDGKIAAATDEDERRGLNHDKISVLIDAGRAPEAIRLASATLRTRPDSATELNQRCWSRVLANVELEAALRDCDLALKNDPENAAVTDSRAWAKLRLGRLDQAIADFDDALRWSPRQSASFYGRGLARLRKGDKAGADKDLAEARRIDFDVDARFRRYGLAPEAGAPAAPAPAGS